MAHNTRWLLTCSRHNLPTSRNSPFLEWGTEAQRSETTLGWGEHCCHSQARSPHLPPSHSSAWLSLCGKCSGLCRKLYAPEGTEGAHIPALCRDLSAPDSVWLALFTMGTACVPGSVRGLSGGCPAHDEYAFWKDSSSGSAVQEVRTQRAPV